MASVRRELFDGEVLYRAGDASECAWLIERGAVRLTSAHDIHILLGPGELFGELGLLEGTPRSATAVAHGDTALLAIDPAQFDERLQASDPIVRAMVESLRRRARSLLSSLPAGSAIPLEDAAGEHAMEQTGTDKIRLDAQLREALQAGALEVRYQPIYDIPAGRVAGYEALVRWDSPERGAVSPAEFIRLAEETSLIVPIGEYVLDRACEVLVQLRAQGAMPLPAIAVNLSARQLVEPGMARQIVSRIERARLPPGALKLEVTESRMLDYEPVAAVMALCRTQGVPFALDDFGTGYSNLTHLHRLAFEVIKVDQAFARHMFDNPRAMAIVEAIVAMAHGLGADVVMEGVETAAQLRRLQALGVRYAQGYLIGKAQPAQAVLSGAAARVPEVAAVLRPAAQ